MAEMDTPLMRDFEISLIFKTANGKSSPYSLLPAKPVVLEEAREIDAIIWASIHLYNDPITEIQVDAVWRNYVAADVLYLADNWVYIPTERRFYQRRVEE